MRLSISNGENNVCKIDWGTVEETQRIIKGHLRALNLIFRPGQNTNSEDRVWQAKELRSTTIPVVSLLVKDHKELTETGEPQVRPVCGVSSSINGDMSEWLSSILYALADNPDGAVVISSEEMLGKIDDLNVILGKSDMPEDGLYIGSLDVKA